MAKARGYLSAAGVGTLGLVDYDHIEASNLQRQVLYEEADLGRPKVEVLAARVRRQSPDTEVVTYDCRIDAANIWDVMSGYDMVVDGTDNFATRYLISDACALSAKPYIYGSVYRFEGQASVFYPPAGPCYRCLFPRPPAAGHVPDCAEGGVLGVLPGQIGLIQATEVVKLILGIGVPLIGRLLVYDALNLRFDEIRLRPAAKCPLCGPEPTITSLADHEVSRVQGDVSPAGEAVRQISVEGLAEQLSADPTLQIIDVREEAEAAGFKIPGSVVMPLPTLADTWQSIGTAKPVVVVCKTGKRSLSAAAFLRSKGLTNVVSLTGGVIAWLGKG